VILLDTNVISELTRTRPDPKVLAWIDSLDPRDVAITAMNEAEILHGLARLPDGRRKQELQASWEAVKADLLTGRIWPFSSEAAHWYGALVSHRDRLGLPIDTADAVIAAIALEHHAQLATRNTKDFAELGLVLINPWNLA
jgi:predicted nucleic acid-binding protein